MSTLGAPLPRLLGDARAAGDFKTIHEAIAGALDCLEELHRHRLLHNDLKLANIVHVGDGPVTREGIRIIDFGSCSGIGGVWERRLQTTLSHAPLKLLLAARETGGTAPETAQIDILMMGNTMWEAITGEPYRRIEEGKEAKHMVTKIALHIAAQAGMSAGAPFAVPVGRLPNKEDYMELLAVLVGETEKLEWFRGWNNRMILVWNGRRWRTVKWVDVEVKLGDDGLLVPTAADGWLKEHKAKLGDEDDDVDVEEDAKEEGTKDERKEDVEIDAGKKKEKREDVEIGEESKEEGREKREDAEIEEESKEDGKEKEEK
ncbi:hypothetical protein HDV00_002442 [Rhizophlyctis rosea]|nr:hypothetical protein HDV00_002442 [Rhizophlyctis rosea]